MTSSQTLAISRPQKTAFCMVYQKIFQHLARDYANKRADVF